MSARRSERLFGPGGTPSVAIIGCGPGGIAAGVNLRKAGIDSFTIFERSDGPGGTWRNNRYPGCDVDIPSLLYSFSFKQDYDWARSHAHRQQLQLYLEEAVEEFGLRPHCQFGTGITDVVWDDETHRYAVRTEAGNEMMFNVVISAVGLFHSPVYPDWPGLKSFQGPKFHTFKWESQNDLTGKRVAVIGTGSTGTQVVPAIAPIVEKLYVFQREPGWVQPKEAREFSQREREMLNRRYIRWMKRVKALLADELQQRGGRRLKPGSKQNKAHEKVCRNFIHSALADRQDLQQAVTPTSPYWGKRPVKNDTFYQALLRDNVELVPWAVTRVTTGGLVDANNVERGIDVLIMATGFRVADFLATLDVVGRSGRSIHETWQGEPQAFLGTTVADFPNFYMLSGPNTNGGNLLMNIERQAEYAVRLIRRMGRKGVTSVEVRKEAMDRYNRWLEYRLAGTAFEIGSNYFKSRSGRVVTQWPAGTILFGTLTKILGALPLMNRYARRGDKSALGRTGEERA